MKRLIAIAIVCVTSGTATAETWRCLYKGRWTETGSSSTGRMDWLLQWDSEAGGTWKVTGDYNDRYGHAWFDGRCTTKRCTIVQDYKSGQLSGKKFYFVGTFTDRTIDSATTENKFTGTWGYAPTDQTSGGSWNAVATCKKVGR